MTLKGAESELLFAYGTLRTEPVQLSTFGRKLNGTPDALPGYRLKMIRIEDNDFVASSGSADQRSLELTGDSADAVEGTVFKVIASELELSDAYEPAGYKRVLVQLRSGLTAWVYLLAPSTADPY